MRFRVIWDEFLAEGREALERWGPTLLILWPKLQVNSVVKSEMSRDAVYVR